LFAPEATLVPTTKSPARLASDMNFGAINDSHQQIATSTARLGQTFAGETDNFIARNSFRNRHPQKIAGDAANRFHAALRSALETDLQITAQIGAAHLEAKIRSCLYADDDKAAAQVFSARNLEARARRSFRRDDEFVGFCAVRIARIVHPHFEFGAAQKFQDAEVNIFGDVAGGTAGAFLFRRLLGCGQFRVVGLPSFGIAQDFISGIQFPCAGGGMNATPVHIGMMLFGEHAVGGADLRIGAVLVKPERRVMIGCGFWQRRKFSGRLARGNVSDMLTAVSMNKIVNIAAYKFVELPELRPLRARLITLCNGWELKGTILLSVEGINLFVAGEREKIELLLAELRSLPGLADLSPKFSETDHQPFRRMLVRLKKEIIAFGVEGINPARRTSPKLAAKELKQWLDEGRPVTLLDTRNDYEVKLGTFKNALPIGVDHFREFPAAVAKLPPAMKEQPIVMFCTGGIRCEKAGPFMEREGFKNIFQLDGGILKYFEECGGAHYDGECFVFDQRVGLDPNLQETESTQCFRCQTPLTEADQADVRYVSGQSCPYCFKTPAERMAQNIAQRHEAIRRAVTPLPGSQPRDNYKPVNVPADCDGKTLLEALCSVAKNVTTEYWLAECERGLMVNLAGEPVAATRVVRAGERYRHVFPNVTEPDVNGAVEILHEDEALIVMNKPAPLPMHAGGRFYRNTLQHILNEAYHPQKPHPAHRLDANTTGLVLVTRTRHFAGKLQPQFVHGQIKKTYLVRVQGQPLRNDFSCDAPISAEAGVLGSRTVDAASGQPARTEFRVTQHYADGTTLLEARPLTGRTNQIRVHLWHLGFPVCGDPVYLADGQTGNKQTLAVGDPPLCLHAWRLKFIHPMSGLPMEFTAPAPVWAAESSIAEA